MKLLDLTDHDLGIYHFVIEKIAHDKLLGPNILGLYLRYSDSHSSLDVFLSKYTLYKELVKAFMT